MKKIVIGIFVLVFFIMMTCYNVYGIDIPCFLMGDGKANTGETKNMKLVLSSDEEIGVVSGKISTNSKIESIIVSGLNGWNLTYNSTTGVFNIYKAEGAKEENILNIDFKVGDSAGTGTITISDLKATTINYETTEMDPITHEITITKPSTENPDQDDNGETNTISDNTINQNTLENGNTTSNNTTNTSTGTTLPKTGITSSAIIFIVLGIVIASGIICIKYKNI